jgi:hypothetical protein
MATINSVRGEEVIEQLTSDFAGVAEQHIVTERVRQLRRLAGQVVRAQQRLRRAIERLEEAVAR